MKNLEQIRAAAAVGIAEQTNKADASRLPALIIANGLLAAASFASENDGSKRPAMAVVMNGVAKHLSNDVFAIRSLAGCENAGDMIRALSECPDSSDAQRATAEALALIGYVKRFAAKQGDGAEV
ncbi:MAG TPA: type III-B CRISPR module-associated protein Cmr5 [Verrucomicrobiota bacterium]|nr:type III-B CRISPR module-associated protein Cmr5 [Verrucomicrobiota bacterium]HNT14584.1 type III-B CRISPR module-associated protein Cmr5 [Verrucomicrobiota bacterium]